MADTSTTSRRSLIALFAAGLGAIGASVCCIGPLVLLALGIGGAWTSNLTAMEPYRWIFVAITVGFLAWAFYKLYIAPRQCAPDDACAVPSTLRNQRIIFWIVTVILIALVTFPYYGVALLS